jgi:hypothetical protein
MHRYTTVTSITSENVAWQRKSGGCKYVNARALYSMKILSRLLHDGKLLNFSVCHSLRFISEKDNRNDSEQLCVRFLVNHATWTLTLTINIVNMGNENGVI